MDSMFEPLAPEEMAAVESAPRPAIKTPIVPVPADATAMNFKHPEHGEPTFAWAWRGEDGLHGYSCRWDYIGEDGLPAKHMLPVTYCDLGNGKRGWRSKGIPSPRPLLYLASILADPATWILICEGEKACDAARDLFPDMAATTPMHGAKSPHLTDFSPCAGRVVLIATDYDEPGRTDAKGKPLHPGRDFGDKVSELARKAGAERVLHLDPAKMPRDTAMPDGWDLADALAEGWTPDRMAELYADPTFFGEYGAHGSGEDEDAEATGWPFRLVANGVEKRIERTDKDTGAVTVEWKWFCSRLEVAAETRSGDGEEWGRLLSISDRDARMKEWAMPMAMLAGDGTAYRERLLSLGLIMAPGRFARDALHEYISTARPNVKARCVGRLGWQGRVYVRFNGNFGESNG